jgi:hypothetical protein
MSSLRLLWYYLWLAPHVIQLGILFAIFRRKLYREYPLFTTYTVYQILQTAILFVLWQLHPKTTYPQLFGVGLVVTTALRFGILNEVFERQFLSYPRLVTPAKIVFRSSLVALFIFSVILFAGQDIPQQFLFFATRVVDRTGSIFQCGLVIFLFIFSQYFNLSWRSNGFGIALGLGIFVSVELATSAVWFVRGSIGNTYVDLITMGTYHCCVLIWLFYLWTPERKPVCTIESLPQHDLNAWNRELQGLAGK